MADAHATNPVAAVRLWIRRSSEPQGPYSIRFEVVDGKGILRVVRPGVLVDPPARPTGFEERLTAAQVGATRFLHVWEGGRSRQAHALTRLSEPQLEALPTDQWVALAFVSEGAAPSVLVLPSTPALAEPAASEASAGEPARVDDEPTWPRREMLAELQRELRELEVKESEHDRTEIRSLPRELLDTPPGIVVPPAPASASSLDAPTVGRSSRAEVVEIVPRAAPRPVPDAPAAREPAANVAKPYTSLDAWLNAPIPGRPDGNGDEEQTILMGGSALAIDRMDGAREPARTALPALAPVPPPPGSGGDEMVAIEVGEAADEESGDFELVALEAGSGPLEALEAPPEDEEDDPRVDEREARFHEVTDLGRPAAPENLHRGQITEPVTVIPLFGAAEDEAHAAQPAEAAIEAGEAETNEDVAVVDESDPYAVAPKAEFHERNTTLVRFLRRRIAADRARITALERQVAELEARLARRAAH